VTEILKSIRLVFSLAIPYIIQIIPRSSKIWVYGGRGGYFVDNTKYWFLWTTEHEPDIKHIWISNDSATISMLRKRNLEAYKPFSMRGFYFILRAKIVFYTHGATTIIRPVFLKTAIKFDFFHGIPLKTMGLGVTKTFQQQFDAKFKYTLSKKIYRYYKKKYVYNDYLVIPSKLFTKMFTDFSGERLFVGYPRNMVFQLEKKELLKIINFSQEGTHFYNEIKKYSRRYIYMPTFREGKPDFIKEAFKDLRTLNDLMIEQNAVLLLKLHPYTKTKVSFDEYSNLKIVNNQIDIYPFLPFIDCLISDYSSISLDYYFSNNPIIFYVFDLNEFIKTSRALDFNPVQIANETTAQNWNDFLILLKNIDQLTLINDQMGKELFASNLRPDLEKLSNIIKHDLLKLRSS